MAEKKFAIRFSAEDMDKVRAALKGMGTDGATALRALDDGSRKATPALKTVDDAAVGIRREFESLASRIPIVGSALQGLSPIGIAVGASLGGLVIGANALGQAARQAITEVSALKDAADTLQTNVESLQAIRAQGLTAGIDSAELDGMLNTLQVNSARASEGFGKMKAALDRVNPELSRQLATATSLDQRMDVLAKAMQSATSQNEKLNIAAAAFGANGAQMIRVLEESGASMEDWKAQAQAAGLVLDAGFVEAVERAGDRIDRLQAMQKVAAQRLVADYAPAMEWWEQKQVDFLHGLSAIVEMTRGLTEQSESYLRRNMSNWDQYAKDGLVPVKQALEEIARIQGELDRRAGIAAAKNSAGDAIASREAAYDSNEAYVGEQSAARAAARKAAVVAAKAATEAAKLREQQEKQAIEIRASLGDWTGKLSQKEAELNALVKAGALSREAANSALVKYRAELDGTKAALERWGDAAKSLEGPVGAARRELEQFVAEAMLIGDRGPAFQAALRYYTGAVTDAEKAAREATPEFKAIADARKRIADEAERGLTIDQKVYAEWERLRVLIGEHGFTLDEATASLAAYRKGLEQTATQSRESSFELRFAAETLGSILDDNMNSLEDLGKVAVRIFRQMAIEWILANQKMAASQSITDFIANAFTSSFGFTVGGKGVDPGSLGGAAYPITGTSGDPGVTSVVGFHHGGTESVGPNSATFSRGVSASIFRNAPRFHSGLAPDEFPSVLQRGERVLSVMHNERLVQAVEGGGAPRVEVNFYGDFDGKPEVKQSQNGDGSLRIDVIARKAVVEAIGTGAADKAMKSRYGLSTAVGA